MTAWLTSLDPLAQLFVVLALLALAPLLLVAIGLVAWVLSGEQHALDPVSGDDGDGDGDDPDGGELVPLPRATRRAPSEPPRKAA